MSQRFKAVFAAILVLVAPVFLTRLAAEAQQTAPNPRIALVIGNATYRDAALATTANDAGLVAQTLQAAGFDVVGARDLDGQSLRTAFRDFLQKAAAAGPDMQAFVYLSGRAVQYAGDNYFIPVDAEINRDADVPIEAIRVSDFSHALAATPGKARIIVLDAARANPYPTQGSPLAPGLALVDPERGELIAFNAAPGTLAGDEEGPYGVYGKTLAGAIRQGGVDIALAFDQTRVSVNAETQGALLPWSASKLDGPYYVFERAADAPPPPIVSAAGMVRAPIASLPSADAYAAALQRDTIAGYNEFLAAFPNSDQARRVRAILAARREAAFWRRTVNQNSPRAYWTYLRAYPKGPHVADADRRLAILSAEFEPPPDFQPEVFVDLPPPPPEERFYEQRPIYAFDDFGPPPPPPPVQYIFVEDDDWRDLPPPPPPVEIGVLPVLGFALPIAVGAVAFHDRFHHDGIAPRGAPRLAPPPLAPPPMPANIKPVAPPPPVASVAPLANAAVVKPLRPIGRHPSAPGAPVAIPSKPAGGAPPAAPPLAPGGKPLPAPTAPALVKPGGATAPPAAAAAPIAPAAPGGKPLPVAPPPKAASPVPAPLAPVGAKPQRIAPPAAAAAPAIAAPTVPGGKPLPPPTAPALVKPGGAGPAVQPVSPGAKSAPAPASSLAPAPSVVPKPVAPARTPASIPMPKPNVVAKPPAAPPPALRQPPLVHAPAPAMVPAPHPPTAAAPRAPRPAPPVVHAPAPAMVAAPRPPPPVVRAPPPALRQPPPVVHAPAPAMVAAPRPPPVVRAPPPALRQPPPAVRAQPAPARGCGTPGLPPCPK